MIDITNPDFDPLKFKSEFETWFELRYGAYLYGDGEEIKINAIEIAHYLWILDQEESDPNCVTLLCIIDGCHSFIQPGKELFQLLYEE